MSPLKFLENARWNEQHQWRHAMWHVMGNMGLTGLHSWPLHRDWIEFGAYPMPIPCLPPELVGKQIVQISDLHYSPFVWEKYLRQYVEWINELKPAVVTVTGDLYMGGRRYAERVARLLEHLKPTHAVLAIMGNHDYGVDGKAGSKRGPERAAYLEKALESHGVHMLRNEVWHLKAGRHAHGLAFVGLDDAWAGQMRAHQAWASVDKAEPVICLVHNPAVCMQLMDYNWQWMLTGHTHGRQLAKGRIGQRLYPGKYRTFTHGLYAVNGRFLYVNRGLSYGQRAQNWCRPEVTVFTMEAAAGLTLAKTSA